MDESLGAPPVSEGHSTAVGSSRMHAPGEQRSAVLLLTLAVPSAGSGLGVTRARLSGERHHSP